MTCHAHITAGVADRWQYEALARHMDAAARESGPAGITSQTPNAGGLSNTIAARCKRQTFRSNEVRKRYLAVHTALSRGA